MPTFQSNAAQRTFVSTDDTVGYDRRMSSIAAFILSGGKSTRMGADKAFLEIASKPLIVRAIELTRAVTDQVRIVGAPQKFSAYAPIVEDVFPDCGPLGGIHAALTTTDADLNLVLAVDLPFVTADLLRLLLAEAQDSGATVTVPHAAGRLQPLCSVYRQQFASAAERALAQGKNKIDALFQGVSVNIVSEKKLLAAGFSSAIFRNLNTPEEWESAKRQFSVQSR